MHNRHPKYIDDKFNRNKSINLCEYIDFNIKIEFVFCKTGSSNDAR